MARSDYSYSVKHLDPKSVMFSVYDPDEIRRMSVVSVNVPISFNALGLPMKGGLYDPLMGPMLAKGDLCTSCGQQYISCPGHFGHIELPVPVFNPLFLKTVYTILRLSCLQCHTLQLPGHLIHLLVAQLQLLDTGQIVEAHELMSKVFLPTAVSKIGSLSADSVLSQVANSVLTQESISEYVAKVGAKSKSIVLDAHEYRNAEVLRTQCLALIKDQYKARKVCWSCKKTITNIIFVQNKIMSYIDQTQEDGKVKSRDLVFVTPDEVRNHLRALWKTCSNFILALAPVLKGTKVEHPIDLFFIEIVPVPPPRVRPVNVIRGKITEHPQTLVFQQVLEHSIVTRQAAHIVKGGAEGELSEEGLQMYQTMTGETPLEKLKSAWQGLQGAVDHLLDAELNKIGRTGSANVAGLKQVISKKEGLIRMHMMGKRVNFAARTVITPDPNIGVDEIGIPEAFAKVLTYPTPVTPWNVDDLRQAVLNGPDVYPGATMIEGEDGFCRVSSDKTHRASLAKRLLTPLKRGKGSVSCKIVHRHLRNGDVLLLNRQPTLHRPSIMAHRAHVLKGEKTFRMHYANCKSYNADFDGDEMNAHFPQSELARAESYFLAQVEQQYLVPKDGTPLSGLIQDHVVSGVRLTMRGRFFTRAQYCLLLQQALPMLVGQLRLMPPAMVKPCRLWSGKQIVSSVLLNCIPAGRPPLSLCDTAKIPDRAWVCQSAARSWQTGGSSLHNLSMSETEVVLRDGELLCGVLDKKHFGSTPYGLAHCVYELYGGDACIKLLSAFARLFTAFLQCEGFTLGVRDILVVPEADAKRQKLLEGISHIGPVAVTSAFDQQLSTTSTPAGSVVQGEAPIHGEVQLGRIAAGDLQLRAILDHSYKQLLDPATNAVSRTCVPNGLLEAFPNNNLQLMVQSGAKGSTVNTLQISCLLGQIELEGRRPPLMPSGKSLPSFQRFDCTPRAGGFIAGRFLTGIQPQEFFFHCMAGREGLIDTAVKTSRSGYLQRCLIKHLEGLVVSYDGTVRDSDGSVVQFAYGEDGLDVLKSQFLTSKQIPVLAENYKTYFNQEDVLKLREGNLDPKIEKAYKEVRSWNRKRRRLGMKQPRLSGCLPRTPDPVASQVPPSASFETLSENLETLINSYMKNHSMGSNDDIRNALTVKGVIARADPGEPVGVLAAQSIGEPSTQMTLNTFHFAGRGEMNMTLGIPRLREVLMLASQNPKTPVMEVPVRSDIPDPEKAADLLRRRLHRSYLSDLLQEVNVTECLDVNKSISFRSYRIHMQFLPSKVLRREHSITPSHALRHVESGFLVHLIIAMRRCLRISSSLLELSPDKMNVTSDEHIDNEVEADTAQNMSEDTESSDDDISVSGDATATRYRDRHSETHEYGEAEGSENEEAIEFNKQDVELGEEQAFPVDEIVGESTEITIDQNMSSESMLLNRRVEAVVNRFNWVKSYSFDEQKERWCEITLGLPLNYSRLDLSTLLREVAEQSVVSETVGIKRAFVNANPNGTIMLHTEGSNLSALFPYIDVLDINRIYSNHIHAVAQTYGIEAARAVLVREVRDVFKAYGITVDSRHLLLVADYMTFLGTYEPLSKRGMQSACSPLQQMSFESSLTFLQSATLHGKRDTLQSPSSRVMLGRPCGVGTGAFSLCQYLGAS